MAREKWDPLRDLLGLQERMNRLFEESLVRGGSDDAAPAAWSPAADVIETGEAYVVEVELPGLCREDVEIQAGARRLVVRGQRRAAWEARPERFHRIERSYGAFQRTLEFEAEIVPQRVTAELHDGLLRLELPKASRRRRVPVERG